jgi:hypothetical protein
VPNLSYMKFINTSIIAAFGVLFFTSLLYLITFTYYLTGTRLKLFCLYDKCTTCQVAKQIAEEDFKKGERNLIVIGAGGEGGLANTYNVLETDYKVTFIHTGCIGISDELNCYNIAIEQLLQKQYGDDFYEKAVLKGKENYYKAKALKDARK